MQLDQHQPDAQLASFSRFSPKLVTMCTVETLRADSVFRPCSDGGCSSCQIDNQPSPATCPVCTDLNCSQIDGQLFTMKKVAGPTVTPAQLSFLQRLKLRSAADLVGWL